MIHNMRIDLPDAKREAIARVGLAGLLDMAQLDGGPSAKAMAAIASVRDHILHVDLDLERLEPLPPRELARQLRAIDDDPQWRERILRGLTLIAMFDGDPSASHLQRLQEAATAFGIDDAPVDTYRRTMGKRLTLLRLDIVRRGFMKPAIATSFRQEGFRGVLATLKVIVGKEDKAMARRYRALTEYPEGTFGRAYADFIRRSGFSFPGEVGGPPPPVMRHDCCHVLGGYGTTAAEEGGVIGFQAGFERLDPFDVLMFVMAEFELGIGVSPYIPGVKNRLDPDRVFAGIEHGLHANTDLIAGVDPWEHFADSLEEVRQRFNVPPRGREPEFPEAQPSA